jgi:hypothetical protein
MILQRLAKLAPFTAALALAASSAGCTGHTGAASDGGPQTDGGPADVNISVDHVSSDTHVSSVVVTVSPATASIAAGATQTFTATVTGASNAGVTWYASGGTISAAGVFTAPASGGTYVVTASSVEDPQATGTALVNVSGGSASVIEPFFDGDQPYVRVMTPIPNVTYFAPATIRMFGHAPYLTDQSVNGYASQVDFYLGTMMVGSATVTPNGPIDMYTFDATNVPAGTYEISARAHLANSIIESQHIPVTVVDVPTTSGPTMNLTSDLVLSGSTNLDINGTSGNRALITSSNGSRIRSASNWSGHVSIQNADIIGLGSMGMPGIEVTTSNAAGITVTNSVFDRTGPPSFTANGTAPIVFTGNTLQPNILVKVTNEPDYGDGSQPSLLLQGPSTATNNLFHGNNIGISFVRFYRTSHWLIGGTNDAAGNIFIGVRAGIEFDQVTDVTVRGNLSHHRYPFGWSQGQNFNWDGTGKNVLAEHNIFRGGSWMVQSFAGEARYNLMIDNNEAFFRDGQPGSSYHHNVFVNVGYSRVFYPTCGIRGSGGTFYNNTIDMGGKKLAWVDLPFIANVDSAPFQLTSVRNNAFTGFAYERKNPVIEAGEASTADYNCFYNPDTTMLTPYGSSGLGAHDCGGAAGANPMFAQARVIPFPVGDGDIWLRKVTVSQILSLYRSIYTPMSSSPLIDAGDPRDDTGGVRNTDIGAIGAGAPHPDDLFGRFGP